MRTYTVRNQGEQKIYEGFNRDFSNAHLVAIVSFEGEQEVYAIDIDKETLGCRSLLRFYQDLYQTKVPLTVYRKEYDWQ